jgi:hypothetical protein
MEVTNDALAFGDVGYNDWHNYNLLRKLGIFRNSASRLMKWTVNDILRSGHRRWLTRCVISAQH